MSAHIRAGAVPRTEDASGAAVGCPQSVESAVLRAFEDESRTVGGRFRYRISLPYRRSLFFTPNASRKCVAHIPYHRWPSPVPNARHRGRLPPQRRRLPYLRRDNQVINLIEVRSFRRASENASHLVVRSTGKRVAVASERPVYPRTGAVSGTECRRRGRGRVRRSGAGCHVSGEIIKS